MNMNQIANGMVTLSVSEEELILLCNALNEVCNGLDVDEFDTRMGATLDKARQLLDDLSKITDVVLQGGTARPT
jgi:hypothetical protein